MESTERAADRLPDDFALWLDATRAMAAVFGALAARGIATRAASVARPTLDDVFLRETGRSLRDAGSSSPAVSPAEVAA